MRWGLVRTSCSARAVVASLVGAIAVSFTVIAAVAPVPAGAVLARPGDDIGNRLIQSIAGYTPVPEGGGEFGESSGPFTVGELAEVVGMDTADLPTDQGAGYARIFATPSGDGFAMAIGLDVPDTSAVLRGFRDAGAAQGRGFQLFPNDRTVFGDIIAYEVEPPSIGSTVALTAFTSGSLTIVLGAADPHDSTAVLVGMTQDQGKITPPSVQVSSTTSEGRSSAYRLGQASGYVLLVALVVGLPAWRAFRRSRRRGRDAYSLAGTGPHAAGNWWAASAPPPPPPPPPPPHV